jgi:hypothetical protein
MFNKKVNNLQLYEKEKMATTEYTIFSSKLISSSDKQSPTNESTCCSSLLTNPFSDILAL